MNQRFQTLVSLYKVFRWVALAVIVLVLFAALRQPAPVAPASTSQAVAERSQDFDAKLQRLADAHQRGESGEARFTAEEVNAVITRTMQEPQDATASPASISTPAAPPAQSEAPTPGTPGGAQIRTVQVAFQGDQVTGQFSTELYGKEVYITLSAKLGSRDGYVSLEPTAFKVGDLIVPVGLLRETFQQKMAEPENREKLKLPDFIASLWVENGELVIVQK